MATIPFSSVEIINTLTGELRNARETVAVAFSKDIVPRTPVDTGHARRNWQATWGAPTSNELVGVDKTSVNTIQNLISVIRTGQRRNAFLPVVIQNNVPYIEKLNAGSSRQAPANFVELSITAATTALSNIRREI
jgi:hypothetical protein